MKPFNSDNERQNETMRKYAGEAPVARTHIVIQPTTWYEGETLCCGWGYLSEVMPEGHAWAFARHFPEAKVCTVADAAQMVENSVIRRPANPVS